MNSVLKEELLLSDNKTHEKVAEEDERREKFGAQPLMALQRVGNVDQENDRLTSINMASIIRRSVQWVPVAGRWTRISIMGSQLDEDLIKVKRNGDNDKRTVILLIPGNPGNEGFYEYFGRELLTNLEAETMKRYSASSEQYILYTVSHLNHVNLPRELRNNGAHNATDRFDLNDQVEHLADFCFEYLPKAGRIVMFGHSIGAYIMLRILPNLLKHEYNIVCACALFPTIERMAESPNGKRLFPILSRLDSFNALFVSLILCWLDLLPLSLRRWFCSWGLPTGNVPECVLDSAAELLCLNVFRNIIHMSTDELRKVCELDESLLKHSDRIRFYYGKTDKWCPIDFGYQMKDRLGEELVVIDDSDCEHAFVIKNSEIMARKLVNWVLP